MTGLTKNFDPEDTYMIIGIIQIGSVESRYDDVYVYMERNENRIGTYRLQPEYTANTSVNAPIRVSKDSTATRPNSRDSWRTSTKVFVQRRACGVRSSNDSIRGGGEGGEGAGGRTPQDTEFVSVALSYCLLRLFTHLTRIFSLNFPGAPPSPPPWTLYPSI